MSTLDLHLRAARQGDAEATYMLVFQHFHTALRRVAGHTLGAGYDDWRIDERLADFYDFLLTPTRNGRCRLSAIDLDGDPARYLNEMFHNFLLDQLRREQRERSRLVTYEEGGRSVRVAAGIDTDTYLPIGSARSLPTDEDDLEQRERHDEQQRELSALILALETVPKLTPRNRYILCTYLLCERLRGDHGRLFVARRLAEQLHMTEAAVKMSYQRSLNRLRQEAKKNLQQGALLSEEPT